MPSAITTNGATTNGSTANGSTTNGSKQPMNIVIVGGSLGGLFAGVALKSLGHNTTILERNPTPLLQNQGAGIVAGGDTLAFFSKYDRCDRAFAVPSQKRMYLNQVGEVVHEVTMRQNMTSWDLAYYLLRANYDGVSSGYCDVPAAHEGDGQARYEYGCTVTALNPSTQGGVDVTFKRKTDDDDTEDSIHADLVIGADGPSSTIRSLFAPEVKRSLAGYCALRGTVPESQASDAAREMFSERFTFFHGPGTQILAYLIPGAYGSAIPGERLVNFVWYKNFPIGSEEFTNLMTDAEGIKHRITLPPGKMRKEVWEVQKDFARKNLPPQFAEIIQKTKQPFAQAITDVIAPANSFMDGRVLLIGDALAGFRPHTVASTSQAAFDAMELAEMVEGKIEKEEFVRQTVRFARLLQNRGVQMGTRSQFGDLPLTEHIKDRDDASRPREKEVYPPWTEV